MTAASWCGRLETSFKACKSQSRVDRTRTFLRSKYSTSATFLIGTAGSAPGRRKEASSAEGTKERIGIGNSSPPWNLW